jgi:hypothetical protein
VKGITNNPLNVLRKTFAEKNTREIKLAPFFLSKNPQREIVFQISCLFRKAHKMFSGVHLSSQEAVKK